MSTLRRDARRWRELVGALKLGALLALVALLGLGAVIWILAP